MDRANYVLASMSPANMDDFSPVQVQKLFFLLDRNNADHTEGLTSTLYLTTMVRSIVRFINS